VVTVRASVRALHKARRDARRRRSRIVRVAGCNSHRYARTPHGMKMDLTRRRRLYVAALVIASLLAMGAVVLCNFTSWDDVDNCYRPELLSPTLSSLVTLCRTPFMHTYMPFTQLLWWLAAHVSKTIDPSAMLLPGVFHGVNLVAHLLTVLVVFAALRLLVGEDRPAFIGALAFAVHPVQVEAVAWISALNAVLGGLFTVITVWQYVLFARAERASRRNLHFTLAMIAFVLGVLSKATVVATPAILLAIDCILLRRRWRQIGLSLAPFFVLAIACTIWTAQAQSAAAVQTVVSWRWRPLVALDAISFYLYKLLVPLWLAIDYGRTPQFVVQRPWLFIFGLVPIVLAIVLFRMRRCAPMLVAGGAIFLLGLLPVLGFIPFDFQQKSTVSDRYLYLPMFGVAVAIAWIVQRFRHVIVLYLIAGIWIVLSMLQVQTWRDSIVLYQQQISVRPDVSLGHANLAIELADVGRYEDAERQFLIAEEQFPNVDVFHNHGKMLEDTHRYREAARYYWRAIMQLPERSSSWSDFARALARSGDASAARQAYTRALELDPNNQEAKDAIK
jgi:tetratricopeptide (TPR) repeat protein